MPYCVENVCMEADDTWNAHLYAVGSRSHVTLIDGRLPYRPASSFKSLDRDCGSLTVCICVCVYVCVCCVFVHMCA